MGVLKVKPERLNRYEQILLEMFETWVDGRNQEDVDGDDLEESIPDPAPRIVIEWMRDKGVSIILIELMAKAAREYGYVV